MLSPEQVATFHRDGFVVLESLISEAEATALHDRFDRLFAGHFETAVAPRTPMMTR